METKVVSYVDSNGHEFRVIVGEETAIARMRRTRVQVRINHESVIVDPITKESMHVYDEDESILAGVFYPDCMGATLEYVGFNKPDVNEFFQLPGAFVDRWAEAVWELIPEWRKQHGLGDVEPDESREEMEKKEMNSLSD